MSRANPGMDMCFMLAAAEQGSHRSTEVSHPDIYISQLVSPQCLLAALAGVCWGSACEWGVSSLHGSMCRVACCCFATANLVTRQVFMPLKAEASP